MQESDDLGSKVHDWLTREGYPLEYFVASTFAASKFRVEQGAYVRAGDEPPREIDVLASMHLLRGRKTRNLVRAYTVVECKWTKSKPWVAFTAKSAGMMSSAVIAQSVASELGQAAIWLNAGHERLQNSELFASPSSPAFGGRQALGSASDVFYNSLRSVAGAANALVSSYDNYRGPDNFPECAVIAFPMIVIEGSLFSASYDANDDQVKLEAVNHVRFHWRGDPKSPLRTTIDVVTRGGLAEFVIQRADDTKMVLDALKTSADELRHCYLSHKVKPLTIWPGATGVSGTPKLLNLIGRRAEGPAD